MSAALRILTIGGSGFVSGTLARLAVEHGHAVDAVTRGQRPLPAGVRPVVADRQDREAFARAVAAAPGDWDLVVDCIGYRPGDATQDLEIFAARAGHLVFVSSDFVWDPAWRTVPQSEANTHYLPPGSYGGDKRACEEQFEAAGTGTSVLPWTVVRPCHIYGPGSHLGCLPAAMRDPDLLPRLRRGEPLALVGHGHFLQQPIFAEDLARLILSAAGNPRARGLAVTAYGPEAIESRRYYAIIADLLGVPLRTSEIPVTEYLRTAPQPQPGMCHRVCALDRLRAAGLAVPQVAPEEGLRRHVEWKLSTA